MATAIISNEDLQTFKLELLEEIKKLLSQRQSAPIAQRWFKSYELKKILPLSHGKIQRLRASGKLPYSKFGRAIIYDYYDRKNGQCTQANSAISNSRKIKTKDMKSENTSCLKWQAPCYTPRCFLRGARCTNVNTFVILPSSPLALRGWEPRNSAPI